MTVIYFNDKILVLSHKILQYHYYNNLQEKFKSNVSFFAHYVLYQFILYRVQLSIFYVSQLCFSSVLSNEAFITCAKLVYTTNI